MPQIEGLKEQQEALKRVKQNLKEVEKINTFLKGVSELSTHGDLVASHNVSITFASTDDVKRFSCPMLVSDNSFILDAAQKFKALIVQKVKEDSTNYRIALSSKETAILEWTLGAE